MVVGIGGGCGDSPPTAALPWTLSDSLRESLSGASLHRVATLPPHPP
jgi:hypothetical protein